MSKGVEPIKECRKCEAIIPLMTKFCPFCNYVYYNEVLSEEDQKLSYSDVCSSINNAFFRLEGFMSGKMLNYEHFNFDNAFIVLFKKTREPQNYKPNNLKLISDYWSLTQQIAFDYDKSDFKNKLAYENESFCKDCESIMFLNTDRLDEFWEFTENEWEEVSEKKITINDILKTQEMDQRTQTSINMGEPENDIHPPINYLLKVFEYNYPCYNAPLEFYDLAEVRVNELKMYLVKVLTKLNAEDKKLTLFYVKNEINALLQHSDIEKDDLQFILDKFKISYDGIIRNHRKNGLINDLVKILRKKPPTDEETHDPNYNRAHESVRYDFYNYWYGMFLQSALNNVIEIQQLIYTPIPQPHKPALKTAKKDKPKKEGSINKFFKKIREGNLTKIEIYNSVEKLTDNFNLEKLKILKSDFEIYLLITKDEYEGDFSNDEIIEEIKLLKEKGKEIPYHNFTDITKDKKDKFGKPILMKSNNRSLNLEKLLFPFEFFSCYQFQAFLETEIRKIELNLPDRDYSRFNQLNDQSRYNLDYNSLVSILMKTYDVDQLEMILGGELKKVKKMSREGFEESKGDFYQSYKARSNWIENTILICDNEFQYTKRLIFKSVIKWCEEWREKYLPQFDPYSPEEKAAMHKDLFKPLWQQLNQNDDNDIKAIEVEVEPVAEILQFESKSPSYFNQIFINEDWGIYIDALYQIDNPVIDQKYNFTGRPKNDKGVICSWIKDLQTKGFIYGKYNRQQLASVLNNEISGLNLGKDGKTFDLNSNVYNTDYKEKLLKHTKILP